jgi:hypothetical protein
MTPADRIRKAALGPTPLGDWLPQWWVYGDCAAMKLVRSYYQDGDRFYKDGTDTERRMFLLFVAEAIDDRSLECLAELVALAKAAGAEDQRHPYYETLKHAEALLAQKRERDESPGDFSIGFHTLGDAP